jgi:hypothetical protein
MNSPKKGKRFRVYTNEGHFDFGDVNGQTFIDHQNEQFKKAYQARHLGNDTEKYNIENLIQSPSLFSYYLLWNKPTLNESIDYLNKLLKKKKN